MNQRAPASCVGMEHCCKMNQGANRPARHCWTYAGQRSCIYEEDMDERNSKRDLVLAPSEYAYMQDVTKGIVKTYTGPTVINPTAQERPVVFNPETKLFEPCLLEQAVQQIAIAPEGYYLILKNPSAKDDHPVSGGVYPSPDLNVGRKINITGPCAFALWPGQMVKLVQGHHLRSNQYLLVRVYNEDEASKNWGKAVIKPATPDGEAGAAPPASRAPADLTVGKQLIIKGTDVSFYIPPTGVGVVPDEQGHWVRDALTLERLEYCILVEQNGKKRYERGPQVVFPEPTEAFITKDGARKFRAVELNEIQGLHIKVIAPYHEHGRDYREGDELFITGKETAIYFPREEHSLVRYDGREKHFAVAVPAGEGRYVMNRKTGAIRLVRGPAMLLPTPVDEVIVRRVLSDRECATWYPGNAEVLAYNRSLRQLDDGGGRAGAVAEGEVQKKSNRAAVAQQVAMGPPASEAHGGEALDRSNVFTKPRALVFNTKFEGVPSLTAWVGYAVLVVDKQGKRRVEQGPKNLLFEYDETLEVIQLSTGTPKSTDRLIETVFLRVLNNKVSDSCIVETSDHVSVTLRYSMRVNFEGEPMRWFEVENYVKFLCDHVRSVLKGATKKHSIEHYYAHSVDLIRDAILGKAGDGEGKGDASREERGPRPGMKFAENGMRITDVEILEVTIDNEAIAELLGEAQHEAVQANVAVLRARRGLEMTEKQEAIARGEAEARAETAKRLAELEVAATADRLRVALAAVQAELEQAEAQNAAAAARNAVADTDHAAELARQRSAAELQTTIQTAQQQLVLQALRAEVDAAVQRFGAAQAGFSEALLALSNQEVLAKVAEAMSVQAFVGGKTLTDVIDRVFAGTPLAGVMERVKGRVAPKNGEALALPGTNG
jgi:major vault protein